MGGPFIPQLHPKGSPVTFPCGCSRENNDPPQTSMSLSSHPEYVSLHGNRDITDWIKLKTLDGEVFLDYPGGPSIISRLLIGGREAEGSSKRKRQVSSIHNGQRGAARSLWTLGEARLLPEPLEGASPASTLMWPLSHSFQTPGTVREHSCAVLSY